MATTYIADKAAAGVQPRTGEGLISVTSKYTLTAALVEGDVIQMLKVPNGAVMQNVIVSCDDLDTDDTPAAVLEVGDGGDTDRYITGSTIAQGGGIASLAQHVGHGYQYTAEDTLDVKVTTAPATAAYENLTITVTAFYSLHDDV